AGGRLPVGLLGLRCDRASRAADGRGAAAPRPSGPDRGCRSGSRDRRRELTTIDTQRWISGRGRVNMDMNTNHSEPRPGGHLELHTPDRSAASAFYATLLQWRAELIEGRCGSYLALELSGGLGAGIVECGTNRPLWLPYVGVDRIDEHTERARRLGARVLLE